MRTPFTAAAAAFAVAALPPAAAAVQPKAPPRLLIVFAPDDRSAALAEQRDMTAKARVGFGDRDLKVIEVVGDTVTGAPDSSATLRRRFGVTAGAFRVFVIGRDGEPKIDTATPITAERLFATIDAMPMRRQEVRER